MLYHLIIIGIITGIGYAIYRSWKDLKQTVHPDKGIINIIVENAPVKKDKSQDRNDIIKEAEAMFATLQRKYLYSPVPYKVMGDFYANKGIFDKAIEKYQQMLRYLNHDLDLDKLDSALIFLQEQGQQDLVQSIRNHYEENI